MSFLWLQFANSKLLSPIYVYLLQLFLSDVFLCFDLTQAQLLNDIIKCSLQK